jgi:uncharacterized protein YjbJ (UPF0337 family)
MHLQLTHSIFEPTHPVSLTFQQNKQFPCRSRERLPWPGWRPAARARNYQIIRSYKERAVVSVVGKTLNTLPEDTMNSGTTDKIKGATNEAVGKAKRAVGKATGSAKLKREGDIQEAKGDAQTAIGKVKTALKK